MARHPYSKPRMVKERKTRDQQKRDRIETEQAKILAEKKERQINEMTLFGGSKAEEKPKRRTLSDRFKEAKQKVTVEPFRPGSDKSYPSVSVTATASSVSVTVKPRKYTGKMEEREQAAQLELEHKKKRVGVTVNKGAYQYLDDSYDPKWLGRK